MAATTAARGGQAGGIVSLLADGSSVRSRHVPTKRGDVAVELVRRFWLLLWLRQGVCYVQSLLRAVLSVRLESPEIPRDSPR